MQKWSQNGALFLPYCKQSKSGAGEGLGTRLGVTINTNQRQRRLKNLAPFPGPFRYEDSLENEAAILYTKQLHEYLKFLSPSFQFILTQIHRCQQVSPAVSLVMNLCLEFISQL